MRFAEAGLIGKQNWIRRIFGPRIQIITGSVADGRTDFCAAGIEGVEDTVAFDDGPGGTTAIIRVRQ